MLTFLHAADFHLDSPFRALPPEQAVERREEQRQLLTRLAETVRETGASLLFLAGDLFDSQRIRLETTETLCEILSELEAEVLISPGNHDPFTPDSPYARMIWPANVHIFTTAEPECVAFPALDCVVYGSAFTAPYRMDSPLEGFHAEDEVRFRFGCFHGDPTSAHSRYAPVSNAQIAASGLDYLALGHIHAKSAAEKAGKTVYAWPGCLEGRGFDETGDKGVYLGHCDEDGVTLEFIPLSRRRYLTPKVDVTGKDPAKALQEFFAQSQREDIVRVTLTGERGATEEWDLPALTALVTSHFYSASLLDETVLPAALWERREEDTLTGHFLRLMEQRLLAAPPSERCVLERAARFGLAALEGREEPR